MTCKKIRCRGRWNQSLTVNPLLRPLGGLLISNTFEAGLNRDRRLFERGAYFATLVAGLFHSDASLILDVR